MASSSNAGDRPVYDYTEGATPIEINQALVNARRSRRDSQYSTYYDDEGEGSMFSGPGHGANPSSVSRMSRIELGRRSSDMRSRRKSIESSRRRRSHSRHSGRSAARSSLFGDDDSYNSADSDDGLSIGHGDIASTSTKRRRARKSLSPPSRSVFGGFANLFSRAESPPPRGGRRRSISSSRASRRSRRSLDAASENALLTDSDEEERWGYSSGEEDSEEEETGLGMGDTESITASMQYDSDFHSTHEGETRLPMMDIDPVFGGEARVDMEMSTLLEPPPIGPPSRQTIYIPDEDSTIRFIGYETISSRAFLWRVGCVLSLGILALLGHWFPNLWLNWVAREKAFIDAKNGFVVVEAAYRAVTLLPIRSIPYPYPLDTVFPKEPILGPGQELLKASLDDWSEATGVLKRLLIVDYRYTRFALDPRLGLFSLVRDWRDSSWTAASVLQGVDSHTQHQRQLLFGPNEIDIETKSTPTLLVEEVIHPFYVFQIASIILWSLDSYYYYAFCIALISTASITSTLVDTKRTIARMREMSRIVCNVNVLRDGEWVEKDSIDLVPGDVLNLSTSTITTLPADIYLLSGDAIVNESMLTGESVPVSKIPVKDEDLVQWREEKSENPRSFMYGGTRVVRIRGIVAADGTSKPALGMVVRTGFNTTKGSLVRSMLFPKPIGFKFYRDSVRFIGFLACIAMVGFAFSAVQFVRMGIPWHTIIVRALDLITVVVPPALPATLSIGTSFAIGRLRKSGIFCISPSRVNVAGKINVCCFDKTGTLTEDGLDILGIRPLERNVQQFGELLEDIHDLPMGNQKANFLYALATCHSLKMVDGTVIGDPLDVKMFEFTKWTLQEARAGIGNIKSKGAVVDQAALVQVVVRPPGGAEFKLEDALRGSAKHAYFLELGVIRTFEFVSALRRMSVIVKRLKSTSMEIYVKGAPEVMADICEPDSFPQDYDDLLSYYTKRGYRVIAVAGKSIEGLSWLKAQRMKREQAEAGLRFLGLVIFENRLKPGTTPAIQALRSANLACRMITGDNPLTAVSVARECSLISQAAHVFYPTFSHGNASIPTSKLEWSCMDDPLWQLDSYSLKPLTPPPHHTVEGEIAYQDYSLVLTGDVFRWMLNYAPLETLQRMLVKAQIFARMSPDEKNEIVERLQALGYTVLMCGDGANDCAALKAADVGISLSEAEASVAAPFTSNTPDIGCVLDVIREGRAALVTSFSCFKYMALYSIIQFTSVTLLYSFASSLGDFQFLYIDLFIIIPIAVTMARTLPYPRIYPKRPTANLVSKKVLASIIGQILITSGIQGWGYLWVRRQPWYTPPPEVIPRTGGNSLESTNFENTTLFLISCFQYILVAAVFSIGPPYRKPMYTNGWLMFSMGLLLAVNIWLLLSPSKMIVKLLTLMALPMSGRFTLIMVAAANVALSMAFEKWGTEITSHLIGGIQRWLNRDRWKVREGKAYKAVEGGMH
ncbi:P-type ATPase [Coprinopsis cinerea okayama7|uniref:Cation-transporting ATPase n=1 Tax=Coprinopsis cinerea (strain Okayama-7 / 130 / ATCC MYA-4618 / FGSC 9003) TaxID=240176 RepID=A8N5Y7_COPC7|nr:P-type ATPase [Coprinopsis cinerea okayama7\|eukprot:XP_001830282.2 P-type ATPase [Coprinopsis cinerea okayama7\